jgi:hypothetical protein
MRESLVRIPSETDTLLRTPEHIPATKRIGTLGVSA